MPRGVETTWSTETKHNVAGAAGLHASGPRCARRASRVADAQAASTKFHSAAGPHPGAAAAPAAESPVSGMAVGADCRQRQRPEASGTNARCTVRDRPAFGFADIEEQCGRRPVTRWAVTISVVSLGAADPLPQVIEIGLVGHDDLVRTAEGPVAWVFSPMPGTAP